MTSLVFEDGTAGWYDRVRELESAKTPHLFYDPLDRVVAILHPNHTYEKVCFDPWQQTTHDVNDTVLTDPRQHPVPGARLQARR